MKKSYLIVPLTALALFIGVYTWSQGAREQERQARTDALKAEHAAHLAAEKVAREKAIAEALVFQEKRKKERAERDAREAAERAAREAVLDARDLALREQERLTRELTRLKRDAADEQEAVNRLQIDKDAAVAEKAALEKLLPQTRANATALETVLEKIAAAEAARLRQAAEDAKAK